LVQSEWGHIQHSGAGTVERFQIGEWESAGQNNQTTMRYLTGAGQHFSQRSIKHPPEGIPRGPLLRHFKTIQNEQKWHLLQKR
jgi:hypothetical protein